MNQTVGQLAGNMIRKIKNKEKVVTFSLARELPNNCAMLGGSTTAILHHGVAKPCSNNLS